MGVEQARTYPDLSMWHADPSLDWTPRAGLPGDREVDVAIVGAGYTGLWTAYYLLAADPSLRVGVIEAGVAGFGASGRNGGWCSALFPASLTKIASISGRSEAIRLQRTMNDSIKVIIEACQAEGIDADIAHDGYLSLARNTAQVARAEAEVEGWRSWGFGAEHIEFLHQAEVDERFAGAGGMAATYTPHCAALHPAKLVRGLATAVERKGASVWERTRALDLQPGRVLTDRGIVRAPVVIRATEGYTSLLPGHRRDIVPMYSLMIGTEPISAATWDAVTFGRRPTFSDKRHLRIYGQRTADGRLAFGGRGAPYHFGSNVKNSYDRDARVHAMLRDIVADLLPGLGDIEFTSAWGGNLGIPRDWMPSVDFDVRTGMGQAGGYVGDGVATSNVAGRTLADLVLGCSSELTTLPWVGRTSPRWEVEPLRWLGVNAVTQLFTEADRSERRSGRPSGLARRFWKVMGH